MARPSPQAVAAHPEPACPDQRQPATTQAPISRGYLHHRLVPGIGLDRIRRDRILHEALTVGADPLHLTLVFQLSPSTASRYSSLAQHILEDDPISMRGTRQ